MYEVEKVAAIKQKRLQLQNPYAFIDAEGRLDAELANSMAASAAHSKMHWERRYSDEDIEKKARCLLLAVNNEARIRTGRLDINPLSLLDPEVIARHLGVEFVTVSSLGMMRSAGTDIEVGGITDRVQNRIVISSRPSLIKRRFTGAHEIGHFVLHTGNSLHRDRPVDAPSNVVEPRDATEREADLFAAFLLMPRKLVFAHFYDRFGVDFFEFTEENTFKLGSSLRRATSKGHASHLSNAFVLASAESFGDRRFLSLADEFRVSISAMAIHLRTLGLIG